MGGFFFPCLKLDPGPTLYHKIGSTIGMAMSHCQAYQLNHSHWVHSHAWKAWKSSSFGSRPLGWLCWYLLRDVKMFSPIPHSNPLAQSPRKWWLLLKPPCESLLSRHVIFNREFISKHQSTKVRFMTKQFFIVNLDGKSFLQVVFKWAVLFGFFVADLMDKT